MFSQSLRLAPYQALAFIQRHPPLFYALLRLQFVFLTLLITACDNDKIVESPNYSCGAPCYGGEAQHAGIGGCVRGKWQCADDDQPPVCAGWIAPRAPFHCDPSADFDCDGEPDSFTAECALTCGGQMVCERGSWVKTCPTAITETCDGKDNDCNGVVDDLPTTFCYSGPTDTLGVGDCHPGTLKCIDGQEYCWNEKTPWIESCNYLDDDCDGAIDEGFYSPKPLDVIIAIDESGSMCDVIENVKAASKAWAQRYADPKYQFALLLVPDDAVDGQVTLKSNFNNASTFVTKLTPETCGIAGDEPTLDVVMFAADTANPLVLQWTPEADRLIVIFGDEFAQSKLGATGASANAAAKDAGIAVTVFTRSWSAASYLPLSTRNIEQNAAQLESELDKLIRTRCGP